MLEPTERSLVNKYRRIRLQAHTTHTNDVEVVPEHRSTSVTVQNVTHLAACSGNPLDQPTGLCLLASIPAAMLSRSFA